MQPAGEWKYLWGGETQAAQTVHRRIVGRIGQKTLVALFEQIKSFCRC